MITELSSRSTRPDKNGNAPSSPPIVPLAKSLSPLPQFNLPRIHHRKSKKTTLVTEVFPSPSSPENTSTACPICNTNEARYACPKCSTPYCSAGCYKEHGTGKCTEDFYRGRVRDLFTGERSGEDPEVMRDILRRVDDEEFVPSSASPSSRAAEDDGEDVDLGLEEDELEALHERVMEMDEGESEGLLELLTPRQQDLFERAVESGTLSDIVQPWKPWWEPDRMTSRDESPKSTVLSKTTLDEQLIAIPSFLQLRPNRQAPPAALQYNTLSLLYSASLTLRLYNGDVSIDREGAAHAFLAASPVLMEDARYTSIPEVLTSMAQQSTYGIKVGTCNTPWDILIQDVLLLSKNWRFVVKGLLEARDVLKGGKDACQKRDGKKLSHALKKIEFYISWCKTHWQEVLESDGIVGEVDRWIEDWDGCTSADDIFVG